MDMNLDGGFSFSDVPLFVHAIFFLPGDTIVYLFITHVRPMASALNMGSHSLQGPFSLIVSLVFWLVVGYLLIGSISTGSTGRNR